MRLFHCADTHLGYRAYGRLVPEGEADAGLNQREVDVYAAWDRLVEAALAERPDVVLHAGDLFDRVRPSNRALDRALEGLYRLSAAGLPVVVVAGNHETPRLRETGHVFRLLRRIPGVHAFYGGRPETVALGELLLTAVPHAAVAGGAWEAARPDPAHALNVLVTHTGVEGVKVFSEELNQATLPGSALRPEWDYVALGHYHAFTRVEGNAWYAGSTERFGFGEAHETKGYAMVELVPGQPPRVEHRELPCREFATLRCDVREALHTAPAAEAPDDAARGGAAPDDGNCRGADAPLAGQATLDGFAAAEPAGDAVAAGTPKIDTAERLDLTGALLAQLGAAEPDGKVVRQRVAEVPRELWAAVDRKALHAAARGAVHYLLQPEFAEAAGEVQATAAIGPLWREFEDYLAAQALEGVGADGRARLRKLAREVLE